MHAGQNGDGIEAGLQFRAAGQFGLEEKAYTPINMEVTTRSPKPTVEMMRMLFIVNLRVGLPVVWLS